MAEVMLFHHAQGLTPGVLGFAEELEQAGHTVHAPDLYDGRIFDQLQAGVGYAAQVGFDTIIERGRLAAEGLPYAMVYAGFSLGVLPAQKLAQTRQGARGLCSFMPAFRSPNSGSRGRRASRSRSTAWTPTSCSSRKETSMPPAT